MSLVAEIARGVGLFVRFFGAAPITALRVVRERGGREAARAHVVSHAARVRRWAGIGLVATGEEHAAIPGGFVLVYNQTSLADDLGNVEVFWRFTDYNVMAAEYALIPFFTRAADRLGIVFLRRGDRAAADALLARLAGACAAGARVSMGAEGRLSPDGTVGHFKRGAFLVAIRAGVPVLPLAVQGGREILAPGTFRCRPGVLRYHIGAPIPVDGYAEADAPALAERARVAVAALYAAAADVGGMTSLTRAAV
jgi:1-acyl-sn-glycerol-3-phosphate acyltransferase